MMIETPGPPAYSATAMPVVASAGVPTVSTADDESSPPEILVEQITAKAQSTIPQDTQP